MEPGAALHTPTSFEANTQRRETSMTQASSPKQLRIGIFQGDRRVEERRLSKREAVTIGQTLSNTFVIPTSAMPSSFSTSWMPSMLSAPVLM